MNRIRCLILAVVFVLCCLGSAVAQAKGGYLRLSEANYLAAKAQHRHGGHTSLAPCHRVDGRTATCTMLARSADTYCTFVITVTKNYSHGTFRWLTVTRPVECLAGTAPSIA